MGNPINPGDVFVESWGYDQTNIDCYVVTRTTPASVYLQQCGSSVEDGRVRPDPHRRSPFSGRSRLGKVNRFREIRKVVTVGWDGDPRLNMTSYSGASLWNETETFYSTFAAGQPGH